MIPRPFKLISALILFSYVCSIFAQETKVFNIDGNERIDDEIYITCINENSSKSVSQLYNSLGRLLSDRGYYHSEIKDYSVDSSSSDNITSFSLIIYEGPQTVIRDIIIDSLSTSDSSYIYDYFEFLSGEVFIQTELELRLTNILNDLENDGFPFASITINSIKFDLIDNNNANADIYLSISKEKFRKIDKVEITGNTKTNNGVIINAARLKRGEIYSQKRIEDIPIHLNKLRFFENVEIPKYFINSSEEGILQINVVEKNTNSFDGILGYVPSSRSGENGYLTGFVNINLRNLFGTGRATAFKWQQENSLTQELEIKYFEPWIFNQPFNLDFQFFQRKQDSSYVKRILGGSLEFLASENISASLLFESESIIPSVNNSTNFVLNSSSFNSGIQLKLDYRDDIFSPKRGTYFVSLYKFRNKNIKGTDLPATIPSGNIEYHNYELDFSIFFSLFQNQVLALGIHAKEVIGDYLDLSDYFLFGGTNTLRGYREKQFLGNRIIWSNLEYRFLLSRSSFVFAFFDSGYYLINENSSINIPRQSDYNNGYGFGISLETTLGIMRVSYALAEGGSISNGLIHFGLLNNF